MARLAGGLADQRMVESIVAARDGLCVSSQIEQCSGLRVLRDRQERPAAPADKQQF
jgi:hypothetical protein